MATKSAAKAHRQSIERRLRNRAIKSATKTALKNADEAIGSGDIEAAREATRKAIVTLDRAGQKGVYHANNVARRKSRLLVKFNAAVAVMQDPGKAAKDGPDGTSGKKPAAKAKKAATPRKKATKKK